MRKTRGVLIFFVFCSFVFESVVAASRLASAASPYLRQHAHNPIDWYPWGEEAFAAAKKSNRLIFLSIGFSTCHWCHVMERESFMDAEIAKELNEKFICIKVDREEHPDVDQLYMRAMEGMGLGGGWPLNVFLTPEQEPIVGGTYFPPKEKDGQPGFREVIGKVSTLWATKEKDLRTQAAQLLTALKESAELRAAPAGGLDGRRVAEQAAGQYLSIYDAEHGGFGERQKFPQPQVLTFLLQASYMPGLAAGPSWREAVMQTARSMARRGLYDHVGDGFSRYCVDRAWQVPHFEKMLYDQAQLATLYLDLYGATGDEFFAEVARGVFRYTLRDLSDGVAFFCAENADSEGHEGKFYTWTEVELKALLSADDFALAQKFWTISPEGNFLDHSHPDPLKHQNVLGERPAATAPLTVEEKKRLKSIKETLFTARQKRVRPTRDEKILASWNGLMLSALTKGGLVLDDETLRTRAQSLAQYLRQQLWEEKTQRLTHCVFAGQKDATPHLRAYAFVLRGVLDHYQSTLDPAWLELAISLAQATHELFHDAKGGGYFANAADTRTLLRLKETMDDAEPAGASVYVTCLQDLAHLTADQLWVTRATQAAEAYHGVVAEAPTQWPLMLRAMLARPPHAPRLVIAGDPAAPATQALRRAAARGYHPTLAILGTGGPVDPFTRTLPLRDQTPTAYLCEGTHCHPPTTEPAALQELLKKIAASHKK